MTTHSSILAWKIPWTEEPGRLQSMGSQRVGHETENTEASARTHTHTHTHTQKPRGMKANRIDWQCFSPGHFLQLSEKIVS